MENKQKKSILFVALSIALEVACLAGCGYILAVIDALALKISAGVEMIALLSSVIYLARGYSKNAAKFYRGFMLFYAFSFIAEALAFHFFPVSVVTSVSTIGIGTLILYGNTLVLALGKDLGKAVSYTLCIINFLIYALPLAGVFVPGIFTFSGIREKIAAVVIYGTWLILALVAFVLTVAKYKDKAARGTD